MPYLRPVDDAYDDISPVHTWSVRLSDRDMARKLREVVLGELQDVKVASTGETGRAATVDVIGDEGTIQISGLELRRLLGLRSHWFAIRRDPARPPADALEQDSNPVREPNPIGRIPVRPIPCRDACPPCTSSRPSSTSPPPSGRSPCA